MTSTEFQVKYSERELRENANRWLDIARSINGIVGIIAIVCGVWLAIQTDVTRRATSLTSESTSHPNLGLGLATIAVAGVISTVILAVLNVMQWHINQATT